MTRQQRHRAKRKAAGLCARCGERPRHQGKANCFACRVSEAARRRVPAVAANTERMYPEGHGVQGGIASGDLRKAKAAARWLALADGLQPAEAFRAGFEKGYKVAYYKAVTRARKVAA